MSSYFSFDLLPNCSRFILRENQLFQQIDLLFIFINPAKAGIFRKLSPLAEARVNLESAQTNKRRNAGF
jgi:hypothetical protein